MEKIVQDLKAINAYCGFRTANEFRFASSILKQIRNWEEADPENRYPCPMTDRQAAAIEDLLSRYSAELGYLSEPKEEPKEVDEYEIDF